MAFVKGKSGNAKGRQAGVKNRYSKELAEKMHQTGYTEPLDILLMMANDVDLDPELRAKAAKDAAVYVHRKKPVAMEITGKFEHLSPEERETRRQLLLEEIRGDMARRSAVPG